uniref:BPI2 domain-containing protein n=1 Tax=Syphacia muris TaxID=451379 RepID=A0A0N5A9J7_9BILA
MPLKVPLSDIVHNDAITESLRSRRRSYIPNSQMRTIEKHFNLTRMSSLFLDYTITENPTVENGTLKLGCSGEIFANGSEGTPFSPVNVPMPSLQTSSTMLNILLTDFVPNSLLYHGHKTGLFNSRVDPSTPQVGPMMRTSCEGSSGPLFCLGDVFPTLRHYYPNRGIAMAFASRTAPVMIFRNNDKGARDCSLFGINGRATISAIDENGLEKHVGEMYIDIEGTIKIRVVHSIIKCKVALEKVQFTSLTTDVLKQDELDDASFLCRDVMQRMINDLLKDRIPVPIHPLFKLKNLKVLLSILKNLFFIL